MSIEPDPSLLSAEMTLRKDTRRAQLLQKAQGRGLFSWLDLVFVFLVIVFAYLSFSSGKGLQRELVALITTVAIVVQWSVMRLSRRLDSLVEYLLEQPQTQEAQQGAPGDAPTSGAPLS